MPDILIEEFSTTEVTSKLDAESVEKVRGVVEQLGLKGQEKFLSEDAPTTFPYRKMTKEEANVYKLLCPSERKIEEYSDSLIPLRVLQIAAHAKSLDFFKELQVWCPESADFVDPVLVGEREEKRKNSWGDSTVTELYILARWGAVLEPFAKLQEIAKQKAMTKLRANLAEIKSKMDNAVDSIESTATRYVNGETVNLSPSFYA